MFKARAEWNREPVSINSHLIHHSYILQKNVKKNLKNCLYFSVVSYTRVEGKTDSSFPS